MIIVRNFNNIKKDLKNSCLTIGNFDGLHLGHQKILKFNLEIAKKNQLKSALLTFEPHPKYFFNPDSDKNSKIYPLAQKLEILQEENLVDIVFLINFNQELASLEAQNFVQNILCNKLKISNLTVGYDFNFGKNRLGNADLLQELAKKYHYQFHQIPAVKDQNNQIYSSTNLRNLIQNGDVKAAAEIFGRNYEISGIVRKGNEMGGKIGFKTANILPKINIIRPKFGVYESKIEIDKKIYKSITNFGVKPTFAGQNAIFETHIFNFDQNIYSKKVKISLLNFYELPY